MADKFSNGVDSPTNLQFGADQFVDTSNPLEALPGAAKALAKGTEQLALTQSLHAFESQQEDYYTKARQLKDNIWQAGVDNDDAAVNRYAEQLGDLKVAEKQGLISSANGQIRQESLLKQTINRFPHREEEIRRLYSSTRARAAAEREQFKDPIETGIDQMISRAYAAGRSPAQQIELERDADAAVIFNRNMEMRAALGQDLQNEFSEMIDTNFATMAFAEINNWMGWARKAFETDKTMTIEMAKGQGEIVKHQIMMNFQKMVNNIVRNSPNPEAVLSRDFVTSKRNEMIKMIDDTFSGISSMDQLVAKQRMMEWGKQLGYEKLMKYDPLMAWGMTIDAENFAKYLFDDWDKTQHIMKTSGLSELNVLIQNSTGSEKTKLQFQRDMILGWNGLSQAEYFKEILGNGSVPESTGLPEVDAVRVNAVVSTALNSRNATPEMKTNAAKGALTAEKVYSKPGEYVGPSGVWFKDPGRRNALRSDPAFQTQMNTEIENSAAALLNNLTKAEVAGSINFAPQMENEPTDKPWDYYKSGGPFDSSKANAKDFNKLNSTWMISGGINKAVAGLNHMYWIKRIMEGPGAAENWAMTVLDEAKQVEKENQEAEAAEAEKAKKKAEGK